MINNIDVQKIDNELDEFVEKALVNYDLPGLGIGVSIGEYSYSKAVGYKDYVDKVPLNVRDIFHMASVTKLLVGTSVLQLEERGILDLDGKLVSYLPEFQMADGRYLEITLKDLLSHTSGMPDVKDYRWQAPETDVEALKRYVMSEEVREAHLLWDPGCGKFAYSNMAYEVLGCVIAEVSGMSFEDYVNNFIFLPLKMENSSLLTFERSEKELCTPHGKDEHKRIVKQHFFPYNRAHGPSSTLTSNLMDLERLAKGFLNIYRVAENCKKEALNNLAEKQLLKTETLNKAWREIAEVPNNGEKICLSWFKREQKGLTLYGHEGTDDGFRASFWICPQQDMHIAVVSNISNGQVKKINKQILDRIIKD